MKRMIYRAVSVFLSLITLATMTLAAVITVSSAVSYYNTYTTVADIGNRSSCSAMQGLAVGSTWLYTVKIKDDNSSAVLQKTNKNTGATTNLTDSNGSSTYSYLNHANDMDVTTIDGYSNLYIATMATGSNSLVRMKIDGSKATKAGSYTVMLNGAQKSVSAVSILSTTATDVNFLFKVGVQTYTGSVSKSATSGTINITPAFKINTSSVPVNGTTLNLSSYTHQGMGYHDGKIFVPLWGGGVSKSNVAIIAVYDITNASGTINSDPNLSFRITSSAYSGFEIESCGISSDNKMYFNANRWTSSSGNYDGVFRFNGFLYSSTSTSTTVQPTTQEATQATSSDVTYFPACDSSYTTISTALASIGVDNSLAYRKEIAAANGMTGYSGTAEENTAMLNLLKAGKLIKPVSAEPTEATTVATEVTTVAETTEATEATEPTTVTEATEDTTVAEVTEATEPTTAPETTAPEATEATAAAGYSLGDVNRDGNVDVLDSTEVQRIITSLIESDDEVNALADVSLDGRVDIKDATLIQMYCAGIIGGFGGSTEPTTEPTTELATEEPTTEPATEEPTTEEPTTEEPTTEPTTSGVTYFPACDASYTTLSPALASIGVDNSYTYRKTIAIANGITDYTGTAEQNTQMLNLLKQGKLIVP